MTNKGKKPHSMQLVWIDGKHTDAEIAKVVGSESGPIPSWLHGGGGVPTVPPGGTGSVTVNLRKATYAFWSDESDDSTGASDLKSGLKGRFTATTDKASSEPTAGATITAKDYGFDVSGLKAGKNTVSFTNAGKELHLVVMFPLLPGKTIADMTKALSADPTAKDAPPPPFNRPFRSSTHGLVCADVAELRRERANVRPLLDRRERNEMSSALVRTTYSAIARNVASN